MKAARRTRAELARKRDDEDDISQCFVEMSVKTHLSNFYSLFSPWATNMQMDWRSYQEKSTLSVLEIEVLILG